MRIPNTGREIQFVEYNGATWVIPPGISVTISKAGVVIAMTEVDADVYRLCGMRWAMQYPVEGLCSTTCIKAMGHEGAHVDDRGCRQERVLPGRDAKRRGKSYKCGFCWIHPHENGRTLYTCIRHQGHDHVHSDVHGHTPTQAEYNAAKACGASDY